MLQNNEERYHRIKINCIKKLNKNNWMVSTKSTSDSLKRCNYHFPPGKHLLRGKKEIVKTLSHNQISDDGYARNSFISVTNK